MCPIGRSGFSFRFKTWRLKYPIPCPTSSGHLPYVVYLPLPVFLSPSKQQSLPAFSTSSNGCLAKSLNLTWPALNSRLLQSPPSSTLRHNVWPCYSLCSSSLQFALFRTWPSFLMHASRTHAGHRAKPFQQPNKLKGRMRTAVRTPAETQLGEDRRQEKILATTKGKMEKQSHFPVSICHKSPSSRAWSGVLPFENPLFIERQVLYRPAGSCLKDNLNTN